MHGPVSPGEPAEQGSPAFLAGGGESGALVRSIDWSKTPLGPVERWPGSLKTTVGIILHSRHPMFLWWGPELIQIYNDAYVPSFGVGKHPAAMGQPGPECWGEIWPIIGPQIEDVMSRGRPSWHENQLVPIFRNGRIEDVYWTYGFSPVYDERGAVGGTLVVCNETTASVLAERRLRTMRALAESATLGASREEEMLACAMQALAGAADVPFAVVHDIDAGGARRVAAVGLTDEQARRQGEPAAQEALAGWVRELGAEPRPLHCGGPLAAAWWAPESAAAHEAYEVFITPIVGREGLTGLIVFGVSRRLPLDGAYRDFFGQITEHITRAETRLEVHQVRAAAEAERTNLLLQAPVATAVLRGPEHVFVLANPLYNQLVGRSDLIGKRYVDAFPELIGTAAPTLLDRVYQTGEPFVTAEFPMLLDRRGDGTLEECFFKFNLEPMRDARGQVHGMMAVALDISELVRARRVLERAQVEREKLLVELEAASRAKDEFLAMLGHELRNPLAPIVTALQLMRLRGDSQTTREQNIIERQVKHLVRLVDDLLDVSRITRGKVELKKESVELGEVLSRAVEVASVLFEQRRHHLHVDVPASGLRWEGDPVRLAQVVANLLTNAARYTHAGGDIHLSATRERAASGDEFVIRVKDNGVGIAAEMLPRVFDTFVQGHRDVDRAEGGLGIGLSLVKNLVAMHGGAVEAHSAGPGHGSEFVVRLPAPEQDAAAPEQASTSGVRSGTRRVLVVDDNTDAADLLAEILRSDGHEVSVAYDPPAALALLERFKPEVAIMDIGLPVMDGYELAARVRATPEGAGCRLIALTGYGQEGDRQRSQRAGFDGHLVKPVDAERLLGVVSDAST